MPVCAVSGGYTTIAMRSAEWLGHRGNNSFQIAILAEVTAMMVLATAVWAAGRRHVSSWVLGSVVGLLAVEILSGTQGVLLWLSLPGINAYLLYRFLDDHAPLEDVQGLILGTNAFIIHLALLLLIPRP